MAICEMFSMNLIDSCTGEILSSSRCLIVGMPYTLAVIMGVGRGSKGQYCLVG